jgi:hypothetical protein
MVATRTLVFPYWEKTFYMYVDESTIGLGAIMTYPEAGHLDHPIAFESKNLSESAQNYNTIEREGLSMVYEFQKFRH